MTRIAGIAVLLIATMVACDHREAARGGIGAVVGPAMETVVAIRTKVWEHTTPTLENPAGYELKDHGMGSGVCVDSRGYIMTCFHVVDEFDDLTVDVDYDHKGVHAELVAVDKEMDLALIRVGMTLPNLVTWGDSSTLIAGDYVFAVGHPFDLMKTAQIGIVSGTNFCNPHIGFPVFLTDAAVNPGHSGGGVFDSLGHYVGMPDAIYAAQGLCANTGIAFIIPGNTVHLFAIRHVPVDPLPMKPAMPAVYPTDLTPVTPRTE